MKRFVYTLESVYNYKLTVEKKQKAELKAAQAALNALLAQDRKLDAAHADTTASLRRVMEDKGRTPGLHIPEEMQKHDAYFRYLREEKKALAVKIIEAEAVKTRRQERLIATMKEIKTYEKLKDEQYQRYLEEVAQEEAKEMGDIVSYKTIAGDD